MHYRAGLNNIPVLEGYRYNPDDWYLLQVGMVSDADDADDASSTACGCEEARWTAALRPPFFCDSCMSCASVPCSTSGLRCCACM